MKIYVIQKGIVLSGKSWEIRAILKDYNKRYYYVKDWVEDTKSRST